MSEHTQQALIYSLALQFNIFDNTILKARISKNLFEFSVLILKSFHIRVIHTTVLQFPVNGMEGLPLPNTEDVLNIRGHIIVITYLEIDLAKAVFQLCGLN